MVSPIAPREPPLAGLRIIDLTRLLPGPVATMHLADSGADVIKVEDTAEGDYMRAIPTGAGRAGGRQVSSLFEAINRGKRSVRIDLKSAEGREVLWKLIDGADAVIEQFRPGVLARLGFAWEAIHARNPRVVLCSISGYGQTGPWAQRAGHDINYAAVAGILDQNRAGGVPALPNLQVGDLLGGSLVALSSLLMALIGASRTGRGCHLDVAMSEGLLIHHLLPVSQLDDGTAPVPERGLLTGGAPCYGLYETADGAFVALGALELKFWHRFCDAVGLAHLKSHHWSLGHAPGSDAALQVRAQVAARLRERTRAEWEATAGDRDCCLTPVPTPADALVHEQVARRDVVHRRAAVTALGPLARGAGATIAGTRAPAAGEHTREILGELGYQPAAIDALVTTGAVGT